MKNLSPLQAIKHFCRKCQGIESGVSGDTVRKCKSEWGKNKDKLDKLNFPDGCPLWPYRMGKGNRIGKPMTEEHKAKIAAALKESRKKKEAPHDR